MKRHQIVFTAQYTAEMVEKELGEVGAKQVLIETEYSVISGGTERACITGAPNTVPNTFPKELGYCSVGYIREVGSTVKSLAVGDRVMVYHGFHADWNIVNADRVYKIEDDSVDSLDASLVIISAMGLGGVRKLEVEIGESAMVMGLGLLGLSSVQYLKLNGACPVIACDLYPERRELALKLGADYALDPAAEDFKEQVMALTNGKGVNACVEVTGNSKAMMQALDCASWLGRISLLGCTRTPESAVNYYLQVHRPGVQLIGAHNMVRPKVESYPHHWTNKDDCQAIIRLIAAGRIEMRPILQRIVSPDDAPAVYTELCNDPHFPVGTVFDWKNWKASK